MEEVSCCVCGKTKMVSRYRVRRSKIFFCSRPCRVGHSDHALTHGMSYTRLYRIYNAAIGRCVGGKKPLPQYGGRGIMFLWKSFEEFRDDMHESYLEHVAVHGERQTTLDRIDVNGHYEKSNCRWATMAQQNAGRRDAVMLTFNGVTMNLAYWADSIGMDRCTLDGRIKKGWSVEDAITIPVGGASRKWSRILYRGGIYSYAKLSKISGIRAGLLRHRITRGMSVEEALTTPVRSTGKVG